MSIDINQFVTTFMEESLEGLDTMESLLLSLVDGDMEAVNAIFRAAHSIKGGAATFGFAEVGRFTHGVETLLDEMRSGQRRIEQGLIALLLESVDCIRSMLVAARDGTAVDVNKIAEISRAVENYLSTTVAATENVQINVAEENEPSVFHIRFAPHENILLTGNDPLRILASLTELGEATVECNYKNLDDIASCDPLACQLSWEIHLHTAVPQSDIEEIFDWVDDVCDLQITKSAPSKPDTPATIIAESNVDNTIAVDEAVPVKAAPESGQSKVRDSGSIRVNTDKVDALINMVGELVITQSMLGQLGKKVLAGDIDCIDQLQDGLVQLERNTRELQETVMSIRMLPISFVFNRFPRMIHDLSKSLGKPLQLTINGEQTELDKNVLEKISDPLIHLVRNAADHGIEPPQVRQSSGKPEIGTITLNAYHRGGNIVIDISDDGAGLNVEKIKQKAVQKGLISADVNLSDEQVQELIFAAGFSTADSVSDVSGRGVGMDVVRKNIKALGGTVEVSSEKEKGSRFSIRLPLTLSILDGQLVDVSSAVYVIPLTSIVESIQVSKKEIESVAGSYHTYRLREEYIPVVALHELLGGTLKRAQDQARLLLVVVESDGIKAGLIVDDLLGQQQVVIKALEANYKKLDGISGATILGDGTVSLILDISGLMSLARLGRKYELKNIQESDSKLRLMQ